MSHSNQASKAPAKPGDGHGSGIPMKEGGEKQDEFVPSVGLTSQQATTQLNKFGKNELPEKVVPKVCQLVQIIMLLALVKRSTCIVMSCYCFNVYLSDDSFIYYDFSF